VGVECLEPAIRIVIVGVTLSLWDGIAQKGEDELSGLFHFRQVEHGLMKLLSREKTKDVAKAPFACQWQEILPSPIGDEQTGSPFHLLRDGEMVELIASV
jgi:hypothetical protein